MGTSSVCIGVSGGHHRSLALALEADGRVLGCADGDPLNLHTFSAELVARRIDFLLGCLAARLDLTTASLQEQCSRIALALPGAASDTDREVAEDCLDLTSWRPVADIDILDDTWAGLVAGTGSFQGVCAFAGTGASVFVGLGQPKGKPNKIDGWGPTIGDYGSGFQLATDMFRFFCRSYDRDFVPNLFFAVQRRFPRIHGIADVQYWFDRLYKTWPDTWRVTFADTARVAVEAAEETPPDDDAVRLVVGTAQSMAESIEIALTRFKLARARVVFQGGMFEHSAVYRAAVARRIEPLANGVPEMAPLRPVSGAALLAVTGRDLSGFDAARDRFMESLSALGPEERGCILNEPQ